jgi:hypothetical protein
MSGKITAFTLQRLNEVAVSQAKYEVDETVRLNEFGGGVTTRRSKPALVRIPVAMFEKEISELIGALSNYAIEKFGFVVGHAFTTASLESYRALDEAGNEIPIKVNKEMGGTLLQIPMEITLRREGEHVLFTIPAYTLEVRHSKISAKLGDLWLLQWSHGAAGETKYSLAIFLPKLRKDLASRLVRSDFAEFSPQITEATAKRRYEWRTVVSGQTTFSIYAVYGTKFREGFFSPLGFILSTIATIVLTLLAQPYLEALMRFLHIL